MFGFFKKLATENAATTINAIAIISNSIATIADSLFVFFSTKHPSTTVYFGLFGETEIFDKEI